VTPLEALSSHLGRPLPRLFEAQARSAATLSLLRQTVGEEAPQDTSVVVFGSLARGEYTPKSDLDWTLLVDGQADGGHLDRVRLISDRLRRGGFIDPGPTGVFGNFAFSHLILHQIGGQDDTNKNTTQRILLLLESTAIGREEAHDRVLRLVLRRYIEDDRGLLFSRKNTQHIPRFLLNDIVRYWRTVTVDFVYKQRERTEGWALRNTKLKMSRKLIFVSGLLTCFGPVLFGEGRTFTGENGRLSVEELVDFLRARARLSPLDQLAEAALRPAVQPKTAELLFGAYEAFLGVLADEGKRKHLKDLTFDDLDGDALFREVNHIGRDFQQGLDRLFFQEDEELKKLILMYGVF
jgi:predicted nucleotidyltransferase